MSAVLSVHAGYDTKYLTDQVARGHEGYYTNAVTAGEPPGQWYGAGAADLGLVGEVNPDLLEAMYHHQLDPRDPAAHDRATWGQAARLADTRQNYRTADDIYDGLLAANPDASPEEREAFRVQADGSARQSVAFIDCTFNVSKSVSVFVVSLKQAELDARAAGDEEGAAWWAGQHQLAEDAIMEGARAVIDYYQEHAGYSRTGSHSKGATGRWVDAHRWTVAIFPQHDNRNHEPHSHAHCIVQNVVEGVDGKRRTIDGTGVFATHKAGASAAGSRVVDAAFERDFGIVSEMRADGKCRELVGVPVAVMDTFSTRSHEINVRADELTADFVRQNERQPSALQRASIRQQATLATRSAKSSNGESGAERQARWNTQAAAVVPGGLTAIAKSVMGQPRQSAAEWSERDVVTRAVAAAGDKKQTWTRSNLIRAIDDALPGRLGVAPADIAPLLNGLADTALATAVPIKEAADTTNMPADMLLANGRSPYAGPGRELFATPEQVAAERVVRAAAVQRGAVAMTDAQADTVLARIAAAGRTLGADQVAAVRGILTSGAAVEVLSAAAGTGKSFTIGAIAEALSEDGGRRVFGLAPSQIAAGVLGEEGLTATNTTRWLGVQDRLARPGGTHDEDEQWRLRHGDLVIIDEAGMASVDHVVAVRQRCNAVGAKLLLSGDPGQLGSVGPGGSMADVAEHGISYELTEVRRFTAAWERAASLALREGDPAALDAYGRHGRLREGGTVEQAEAAASRAWLGDTLAGRDSLLLVGTNEQAGRVSAQLRDELVSLGRVEPGGVALKAVGTVAGVGDLVQTRRNAWDLIREGGRAVANRDVWRVVGRDAAGALRVQLANGNNVEVTLPPRYVAKHVALAYASTVHGAQGRTVDTCHALIDAARTRLDALYVALTRGRDANTAWAVTRAVAPDSPTGQTLTTLDRSARAVAGDILAAGQHDQSALTQRELAQIEARSGQTQLGQLIDHAEQLTAGRTAAQLDDLTSSGVLTAEQRAALAADDEMWSLERLLRTAELAGHDPAAVLAHAASGRSLDDAVHPTAVLHKRITTVLAGRLTPELTDLRDLIPRGAPEDSRQWMEDRADAAEDRRRELGAELAAQPPEWAIEALGAPPEDAVAAAEWEHQAGAAGLYRELVGYDNDVDPLGAAPAAGLTEKAALFRGAHVELGLIDAGSEEAGMSEGQLRARVVAAQREERWAPAAVGGELDDASQQEQQRRNDAAIWAARADTETDPAQADRLRADAAAAALEADSLTAHLAVLEMADEARTMHLTDTAVTRDLGERSGGELRARGIDVHDRSDRVTAEEWLTAHRAAQAEDDQRTEIDENEVSDTRADDTRPGPADAQADAQAAPVDERCGQTAVPDPRRDDDQRPEVDEHEVYDDPDTDTRPAPDDEQPAPVDGHAGETAVPDIRETATPHPTERTDPPRGSMRAPDETAAVVARAQDAVAEVQNRRAADAERAAAETAEATETARADTLTRWAEDDRGDEQQERDRDDQLVMER